MINKKPDGWTVAADDRPNGASGGTLDVLIVAKSGCPGCPNCCAWLQYSYGKSIDVTVLGAGCGKACDGLGGDYEPFKPFKDQLPKPKAGTGEISKGSKGNEEKPFEIYPK